MIADGNNTQGARKRNPPCRFKPESHTGQSETKKRRANKAAVSSGRKKVKSEVVTVPIEYASTSHINKHSRVKHEKIASPSMAGPSSEVYLLATAALARLHPQVVSLNDERRVTILESCGLRTSITDALVSTILSQNTTDANAKAAFASLKRKFPGGWNEVVSCEDLGELEAAIRVAGLAKTRAAWIRSILRTVKEERGEPSLEYLRSMTDDEVKRDLRRFKGMGPKTISCVLLFALGRAEFPVDTHVLRISQKLGWVSQKATRESAYDYLNKVVPADVKLDLHCLLVTHGKICHRCAANGRPQFPPKDGKLLCPLVGLSCSPEPSVSKVIVKNETVSDEIQMGLKQEEDLLNSINETIDTHSKEKLIFVGAKRESTEYSVGGKIGMVFIKVKEEESTGKG